MSTQIRDAGTGATWGVSMAGHAASRVVTVGLWAVTVVVGAYLSYERFMDAVNSDMGTDLRVFTGAAALLREGASIYGEQAYVYSPLISWLLLPFPSFEAAAVPWTVLSLAACWIAVAAVVATLWTTLRAWQRPIVAGVGLVTILWNYALVLHLWLGQTDTLVLALLALGVLLGSRGHAAASGIAVGLTGIIKTWPVGFLLWFARRGAARRWVSLGAAAACWAAALLLTLAFMGPRTFADWIARTLELSEQRLVAYSALGLGRHLFTENDIMDALVVFPILGTVVGLVLAAGVAVLAFVTLRHPGSDSFSMWNLAGAIILLLPVSHIDYRLLMLPLLWVWLAHALSERSRSAWAMTAVMLVFWWVTFRIQPVDSVDARGSSGHYLAVMAIAFAAPACSVLVAARRDRAMRKIATAEPAQTAAGPA